MPDEKVSEVPVDVSPTTDDRLLSLNDPSGTPEVRTSTIANILALYDVITATLTNKTMDVEDATNVLKQTTPAAGEYLRDNGTKFVSSSLQQGDLPSETKAQLDTRVSDGNVVYEGDANTWGAVNQNIAATGKWQEAGVSISPIGVHDMPIPVTAMYVTITEPATGLTATEFGAAGHKITLQTMDFTSTTVDERVQFRAPFPREYNNGTIDIQLNWSFASGTGNVRWGARLVATGDNEAIATNFGTAVASDDTAGTANQTQQVTLSTITIGNTPADTDEIHLEIFREGSHANDTFSGTARLHSAVVRLTTDAATSA